MVDRLVLINGLPGSGKTTLAGALARALHAPLISKDEIKEALADAVPTAPSRLLGMAAAETLWTLAAGMPGTVVLESWWLKPRDLAFVRRGLRRCGTPAVVEVWCEVDADVARDRYTRRQRHPIHEDRLRTTDEVWTLWSAQAAPLGVGPTVRVRTEGPVDAAAVANDVVAAFA